MTIKLSVPGPEQNLTVETRPKQVAEWLAALPLTNLNESSRATLDALSALNRSKVAEDARLKLLELYRATIINLMSALETQFSGQPLPLPEKSRIIASQARQLQTELAYGYKIILLDLASRKLSFGSNKQLPLVVERAIDSLGRMLVVCYQTYAPTPAGVWAEMHILFTYAVEQGIQDEAVPDQGRQSSVNLAYKQALLLALLDPYRLMQGEVNKVQEYLTQFGGHAHLQPLMQTSNPSGYFLVRLDSDKPPRALAHETTVTDERTDILLNTIELARTLHQQISQLEAGVDAKALQLPIAGKDFGFPNLLRRMLKHWGIAPKRLFNRVQHDAKMEICAGIRSIHHFLSGDLSGGVVGRINEANRHEATDITLELADSPLDKASHQTYVTRNWLIINESAGGLALAKDPKSDVQVQVGEIIGLRPDGNDTWSIGVVRWVSSENPNHLQLGAQMLAPTATPAMLRPLITSAGTPFQPALLLPEIPALKQPATLVCLRGGFFPQREFLLDQHGTPKNVRATRLLEQTATFDLFEFTPVHA
ncbi:MAG: hypothetical protein Q8N54_02695 [Sulfurimicrobium sp.]|nr:hypothetical protein [Sulfurimicrobium sp.]MDO9188275.1 hypothetical protein [Sulfurimicrobium sp.]MDP1704747.1 hypothetical protein [Sulfurimicrobium sp.]MDP2197215.1 hypothetical protein [Sulfurimicrobium sp.]MDP2961638.1 hypothetical protein [Sulfurimicrobium sp.]